ncbi:MAG: hypothetical protein ABIH49_02755 [archaeon]
MTNYETLERGGYVPQPWELSPEEQGIIVNVLNGQTTSEAAFHLAQQEGRFDLARVLKDTSAEQGY